MKYLMINTAGKTTEVLAVNDRSEQWFCDENGLQASKVLLTAVDRMTSALGIKPEEYDFFGCVIGPGSFTGIRIGAVTVKTLCYALNKQAKGVSYNRMLAYSREGKVLSVVYGWEDTYSAAQYDGAEELAPPTARKQSELAEFIKANADYALVTDERANAVFGGTLADERSCMRLAAEKCKSVDGDALEPLYAMLSQAEREKQK